MTASFLPARAGVVHGLLVLSGFAGLGYQIVWTRMLTVGLGHEVYAVLAVVAAFFAGLALGALLLDARIARSAVPGRWYAGLELIVGVWTLALAALLPHADVAAARLLGADPSAFARWAATFLGLALLLAPATIAMGATLPAAERLYARLRREGRGVGGLYAANTAGAMLGAAATAAYLAPTLGFTATLYVFAGVNLLCAAVTLLGPARGEAKRPPLPASAAGDGASRLVLAVLFVTGLLGIGYEVATVRALSQVLENTIYSFAAVLVVYLFGAAVGAGAYQRFYARRHGAGLDRAAMSVLAALTAGATAFGALATLGVSDLYAAARAAFGAGFSRGLAAEFVCALVVLWPASVAMGALFSHLAQAARGPEGGLGAAFAANTLGGALAAPFIGVVMIPVVGVVATLCALALAYAALAAWAVGRPRPALARIAAPGLAALIIAFAPIDRRLIEPPAGGAIRAHREGVAAAATVVSDARGDRHLRVNGTFTMGGTASYALDRIQGHAALLQHPAPKRALFLGVGTGATLAAAAAYDDLETDGVELFAEVLALLDEFPAVVRDLEAAAERDDRRIAVRVADARRFVRASGAPYDVILADNFHPAKDGAAFLYTREHFEAVRARLSEDGVFVQWLPLHQLDLQTFKLIARTFLKVFPDARLSMGNANLATPILALTGAASGAPPRLAALAARDMPEPLLRELAAVGLDTPFALFGGFLAGPDALAAFVGDGEINTDDRPAALFEAPRTVYERLAPASTRLAALIDAFAPDAAPQQAVDLERFASGDAFADRLAAYWRARDAFIRLGLAQGVSGDPNRDARALAPKLIDIVKISPDYAPAYTPVLAIARGLAGSEPTLAGNLLSDLQEASPNRPEAAAMRARLPTYRSVDRGRAQDLMQSRPTNQNK